jgi:ferritin-like metal-binding protein YciE
MKNTTRTNQPQEAKGGQRQNSPAGPAKQTGQAKRNDQSESEPESEMDSDLHDLFLDELADMLHAERQITKALPKLIKAAEASELRTALQDHLAETQKQIARIEQVFASLDEKVEAKPCKGMQGILEEGDEMVKEMKGTTALDAVIIAGGQKVEHYEIASYGTLVAWAEKMGHDEAARLLGESLAEEKAADEKLTEIAESLANEKAD